MTDSRRIVRPLPLVAAFVLALTGVPAAAQLPAPPVAKVIPRVDTLHGDVLVDNYAWLRDRRNPEVISYLEAENAYTAAALRHTEKAQERLYHEMVGRIKETDLSVPERRGEYFYYTRTEKGKQYPIYCRKRGSLTAREEVILDQNALAEGRKFMTIALFEVSPDHQRLAFSVDTTGYEDFTLMVKDLRTGTVLPDRISHVSWSAEWAADNRTLFYTTFDSAKRSDKVWRHAMGEDTKADQLIYHDPDLLFNVGVSKTKDGRFVLVSSGAYNADEVHYLPADRPLEPLRVIQRRQKGREYSVEHHGSRFLIVTNDSATNFRLMEAPEGDPRRENWKVLLAHRDSALLDGIDVFRDHLVVYEREAALKRIRVVDLKTNESHYVTFPEPVYTYFRGSNPDFASDRLRFTYASLITPNTVYDYDLRRRSRELKKRTEVLGGYDPSRYQSERTWAKAADGTMVPVSLVYRKPLVRDGKRALLLYSYGSYGSSTDPTFSAHRLSLLDRGVVYAIAHIRGGQEMGRSWYDQGKLLNKKNTFTDFIAAGEHLVREKYTSSERMVANGGSAGGLLMGAVVNMRPELFKAVVADVPFVDVINTMLDPSIPLTAQEWEQWGNPRDSVYYRYMKSYSPYDNVERKAYPTMLVTTGLNDSRVAYWEPAKWTAKLRAMKTDSNRLLLKTNMGAGHGGSSGRYDAIRELAFRYAFILDALGLLEGESISMR